jgi:uncharacterized delta-60 repeat protein
MAFRSLCTLALACGGSLAFVSIALADPATLDPSFGSGGISAPALPNAAAGAFSAVRQVDGKTVAAGCIDVTDVSGTSCRYALARYDTTGALDPSFGSSGVFVGNWPDSGFHEVALQSDGKIVGAGFVTTSIIIPGGTTPAPLSLLARFNADGTLDTSFSGDGLVTVGLMSSPTPTSFFSSLVILPGGKIVAVGTNGFNQAIVARFLPDGTLDSTFSGDGWTEVPGGYVNFVLIAGGGYLLIGGGTTTSSSSNTVVARVDGNGVPDPDFGSGGSTIVDVSALAGSSGEDRASSAVILPDRRFVTAGLAASRPTLVRWLSNGTVDPSYGSGGIAQAVGDGSANDLVRTTAGKFLVAIAHGPSAFSSSFQITRFLPDGTLDAGFGPDGSLVTPIATNDRPYQVILYSGTALLVGGANPAPGVNRFALVRYLVDDELPPPVSLVSERGRFAAWMGLGLGLLGWLLLRSAWHGGSGISARGPR